MTRCSVYLDRPASSTVLNMCEPMWYGLQHQVKTLTHDDAAAPPGLASDANDRYFPAGAVELRNTVSSLFGLELPATATFDHPTADALARYIASRMAPIAPVAQRSLSTPQPIPSNAVVAHRLSVRSLVSSEITCQMRSAQWVAY